MKGGPATVPDVTSAFIGSRHNTDACASHAQAANTYYATNGSLIPYDPGDLTPTLAAIAVADLKWARDVEADARVAQSATSSWVKLLNASNDAWSDLVKQAESMYFDVFNKKEKPGLEALAGKPPPLGDQQVAVDQAGGAGMGLAVDAKRAKTVKSPEFTGYQAAMKEYTSARDALTPTERDMTTQINEVHTAVIKSSWPDPRGLRGLRGPRVHQQGSHERPVGRRRDREGGSGGLAPDRPEGQAHRAGDRGVR
jgi:hypothetical protein